MKQFEDESRKTGEESRREEERRLERSMDFGTFTFFMQQLLILSLA